MLKQVQHDEEWDAGRIHSAFLFYPPPYILPHP